MNPSEIQSLILGEHEQLRVRLRDVEAAVLRAASGEAEAGESIRRRLRELLLALRSHVRSEEAVLVPALAAADAWGPQRVARMRDDHVARLRLLASWEREASDDGLGIEELGARLGRLARRLVAEMEAEERELLCPWVLRDDVVAIGQSSS